MKQFVSDVQEQQLVEQAKKNKDFNILLKGLIKDNILLAKTTAFTLKKRGNYCKCFGGQIREHKSSFY